MKIALLSNVTIDILAGALKKDYEVYTSPGYDTWQQEIMAQDSGLYEFAPDAVVILLYAEALHDIWDNRDRSIKLIDEWFATVQQIKDIPVFISSIDINGFVCHYGAQTEKYRYLENYFVEQIWALHDSGKRVYELPVDNLVQQIGRDVFYSNKMWYLGSMPYSNKGIKALTSIIDRYIGALSGQSKKCLVIDLDNTLWGGVIGEDGVNGIILSDNKQGSIYKDTQRIIKRMKEQGVMLAVVSKNNADDVESVFSHPDMVLTHDDFVAEKINWSSKTQNIRELADELNIGLDSFVFLDDNPIEREMVKEDCPEVAIVDFPDDTSKLPGTLEDVYDRYFFTLEITTEDRSKTSMYKADASRKKDFRNAQNLDDFLRNLKMKIDIHLMKDEELPRVTQLINKSNQFNLTTYRYTEREVREMYASDNYIIVTTHVSDKYGGQGLVSVLIIRMQESEAIIDTFLMSCRVMGRKVENEIISYVRTMLEIRGIREIKAEYIRTQKNTPVQNLYENLGFHITSSSGEKKEYIAEITDLPESTGIFEYVG